ncbi:hypothetical protein P43SY_008341 [Pythium insidiosum]|uniref:Secreted protein n=1 Tax=Pythium insidiosum TaxID=114742 RepID=A0AAD5LQJ0_PYTIN|nr:hypothetical protein P43SY_008341 [Pythium insidiosum]KAJ0410506.1 hypothetical protein ATCC90586_008313 [Pythium insidiosum]
MKTSFILAVAAGLLAAPASAKTCLATCRSALIGHYASDCSVWREELPRPDLYNDCQTGYRKGRESACREYCSEQPDEQRLDALRIDSCDDLRAQPPRRRHEACTEGYVMARTRAKNTLVGVPRDGNGESNEGVPGTAPVRKLSVKRQAEAKNILEQAREEAHAAFHEAKASDL